MSRAADVEHLYALLRRLAELRGQHRLSDCTGSMRWPRRGVYFFLDPDELRGDGAEPRVVRVGTHALTAASRTTLWQRLAQHRGNASGRNAGGGNHRGSIFRKHVGAALIASGRAKCVPPNSWGQGSTAPRVVRLAEHPLECEVSNYIRRLPFVCLPVDDPPGPASLRREIEMNVIGLLSNRGRRAIDPPSRGWLGLAAPSAEIRESGLWNINHVDCVYSSAVLDRIESHLHAAA